MTPSFLCLCGLIIGLSGSTRPASPQLLPSIGSTLSDLQMVVNPAMATAGLRADRFDLIDIDTLFYIENRGITAILVDVNGHPFKLVVDPVELRQSGNAFLIPEFGEITINIAALIYPGDGNYMEVASRGPEGTQAELIIGDLMLPGQQIAYVIRDLPSLPERFALLQNYPNPFSDRTTITYTIPEQRTGGVDLTLAIYDVAGRRLQVLVNERRYPGTFTVEWDGMDAQGRRIAAGVYFCHLLTRDYQATTRLVYMR